MKITYQILGKCVWHSDCEVGRNNGIMKSIEKKEDKDLMECGHCGKKGYYPVGGVGEMEVEEVQS